VVLFGFLMAAACGYLAGLLGSSSSPISGIGILTTMVAAGLLPLLIGHPGGEDGERFATGLALLVAAVIVTTASIANDNLQDLKTGQIVDATPWRQQAALVVGVGIGALVIAPLLALLYRAYGFVGALPREGMEAGAALPAPQAALMAQIAGGIVHGRLPWTMVLVGAGLGVVFVAVEATLRRRGLSFPALTVGIGRYLPLEVEMTIALGGVLGWLGTRALRAGARNEKPEEVEEGVRRRGVLLASGFLVGESLVGVILAAADTLTGRSSSLAVAGPGFAPIATGLGLAVFLAALAALYRLVSRPA
jgi:putative OPT family oligopeptide transporter